MLLNIDIPFALGSRICVSCFVSRIDHGIVTCMVLQPTERKGQTALDPSQSPISGS